MSVKNIWAYTIDTLGNPQISPISVLNIILKPLHRNIFERLYIHVSVEYVLMTHLHKRW